MAIRKSPILPFVTAILTILLLTAFTVFSIGVIGGDDEKDNSENITKDSSQLLQQQIEDDVIANEIHYFESLEWIHSVEARGQDFYIVVFDVGTTGTRAHVFHFGKSNHDNSPTLLLSDEVFESAIPLTDSMLNPSKAAEHCLSRLVHNVTSVLPESAIASTQILLQATENVRQMGEEQRQELIKAAYDYLRDASPLLVHAYDDSFGVLDSQREGLYQWMTINYINGALSYRDGSTSRTSGVIGIGGGSVQMTFEPRDPDTLQKAATLLDDLVDVRVLQHSKKVYSHSYSGLGRAESRIGILQTEAKLRNNLLQSSQLTITVADILGNTHQQNDILHSTNTIYSVCLPSGYAGVLTHDDITYDVTSSTLSRPHSVYDVCTIVATVFLDLAESGPIKTFPEVNTEEFYVFEKRLRHSVGMSDDAYGSLSVADIKSAAKRVCNSPDISEPFACIDLIYTHILLQRGFGFDEETIIHIDMPVRLDGALSWALGFVLEWLQNHAP